MKYWEAGGNCILGSFYRIFLDKYYWNDQIKEECIQNIRERRGIHTKFW
jgi:hypothetical protein